MKLNKKIFFVVFAAVIIIVAFSIMFLYSSPLIFTRSLPVGDFEKAGDSYSADVTDSEGNRIADIYIGISNQTLTTNVPVKFSIWHLQGTELDSLSLVFSSIDPFSLALETPEGLPWPSMNFHKTSDGRGVVLEVADLGFQGEGTVTLDFILQLFTKQLDLSLSIKFSLHDEAPFTFTRSTVDAFLNVQIQKL